MSNPVYTGQLMITSTN